MTSTLEYNGSHHYRKGKPFYKSCNYEEALKHFEKAIVCNNLSTGDATKARYCIRVMHLNGYGTCVGFKEALGWFKEKANNGRLDALYELGSLYMKGKCVQKQIELGHKYVLKAAKEGNIDAQLFLGSFYQKYSVHRDFQKSLYWLKQATVVDNRDTVERIKCYKAHYLIGLVYKRGLGVPVDLKLALSYFEISSDGDYGIGTLEKGLINYFSGTFGPKQEEEGLRWLRKLARKDSAYAQAELGVRLCQDGSEFQDYKQAMIWLKKAVAYNGNTIAQWGIGNIYKHGWGVEINYAAAIEWYKKAADCDESRAQHALGKMYAEGKGVTQDWEKAVFWYEKAVENDNNPEALYYLSQCYYRGYMDQGIPKDTLLGLKLLTSSAEQGFDKAQKRFRLLYDKGGFTRTNSSEALALFKKSILNDASSVSLYNIGKMFFSGSGVQKNFGLAIEYYTKSDEWGYKDATRELKRLQLIEDSKKLMASVNEDPDDTDSILSSLKITSNQDDASQRKIDKAIFLHMEDTRSAKILETDESPKFFHVENTSRTTVINNNDEGPHFFHVENIRAINFDFNPRISNASSFLGSRNNR
ncbi:uncharacterized protein EV154DRAFT_519771 [Mucor mucedo]|uniref:uncharacterized protein n=1 Tax=Mucor mucedo TaxID=29922 RepID=UPI00221FC365|nr:uncharacterized protein EV154DRAFT_519771 [Mucor mucedo]KAI7887804.1 hypothetical protein EV154DRAFT_519771 [Mucor mucedo]